MNGLPPLTWSPKLAVKAGPHSADMAYVGLFHSNLTAMIYSDEFANFWTLGENVLVGPNGMSLRRWKQHG